ncbi:hypothetical protein COOONC_04580 [Cooperia oncophora]
MAATKKIAVESDHPRRFSLAHQASCEAILHADVRRQATLKHREQLKEITKGEKVCGIHCASVE